MEMLQTYKDETKDGLRLKDGKDNLPKEFTGDKLKFRGWSHQVFVWAASIYPGHGKKLLEDATKMETEFDEEEDLDDITHIHGLEFSKALYRMLSSTATEDAMKYVVAAGFERGLRAWQILSKWYDGRQAADKESAYQILTSQERAKSEDDLQKQFMLFEKMLK